MLGSPSAQHVSLRADIAARHHLHRPRQRPAQWPAAHCSAHSGASGPIAANPRFRWRGKQPRIGTSIAAQAAAGEQQAADDDVEAAVLAAWDDGWGGPLEVEEDPAAEIWFDYEVPHNVFPVF